MKVFGLILLMLSFSGCLPLPCRSTVRYQITGKISDYSNKEHILIQGVLGKYHETASIEKDGSFTLGPFTQWHYLFLIGLPGSLVPYPDRFGYVNKRIYVLVDGCIKDRVKIDHMNEGIEVIQILDSNMKEWEKKWQEEMQKRQMSPVENKPEKQ